MQTKIQSKIQKVQHLKELVGKKIADSKPVKILDLSSPAARINFTVAQLGEYMQYVDGLSLQQQKDMPYAGDDIFNILLKRIRLQSKIMLVVKFKLRLDISSSYDFSLGNLENVTRQDVIKEVEKCVGRKFNPGTDYPQISEAEMKEYLKEAVKQAVSYECKKHEQRRKSETSE